MRNRRPLIFRRPLFEHKVWKRIRTKSTRVPTAFTELIDDETATPFDAVPTEGKLRHTRDPTSSDTSELVVSKLRRFTHTDMSRELAAARNRMGRPAKWNIDRAIVSTKAAHPDHRSVGRYPAIGLGDTTESGS